MGAAACDSKLSVEQLPPSIFAIVMATGILSIGLSGAGFHDLGYGLFALNALIYVVLWALLIARLVRYPVAVGSDYRNHAKAPGFFTMIAATCILGNQFTVFAQNLNIAFALWILGLGLWFFLTYSILSGLIEAEVKPQLETGLNGAWLLAVVGTQSISVLGSRVCRLLPSGLMSADLFIALTFWLIGGMLYLWLMGLIFYRCLFLPMKPEDLTPPYWINMGAMAISTLAGLLLVGNARKLSALGEMMPFLQGLSLLFWATATWWIPMLLVLGAWRHIKKKMPLAYDHGNWAAVFPLGMYTVCTQFLVREMKLSFLNLIPEVFLWIAFSVWTATIIALVLHLSGKDFSAARK